MPLEMVVLSCKTPPHCEYQTVSKPVQCPQKKNLPLYHFDLVSVATNRVCKMHSFGFSNFISDFALKLK